MTVARGQGITCTTAASKINSVVTADSKMNSIMQGMRSVGCSSFAGKTPVLAHTGAFRLHLEAKATLDSAEVRESVRLPPGVDEDEWIAAQVLGIYEEVSLVVNLLEDVCTEDTCPCMNAGKHVTYSWADERNRRPVDLSAPCYMQTLVEYAFDMLSDPSLIPQDGTPFPREFRGKMGMLLKRFFRVYAHAYIVHFEMIQRLEAEAHLNMFFKHYMAFVVEFSLVSKSDMLPLNEMIEKWAAQGFFQLEAPKHGQ